MMVLVDIPPIIYARLFIKKYAFDLRFLAQHLSLYNNGCMKSDTKDRG